MRRLFNILIPALVLTVMISVLPFYNSCQELYDDVLRIHILANSDSAADQSLKLAVRDRVVSECSAWYDDCVGKESAMEATAAHLSDIESAARDELLSRGFDYSVRAELGEAYFNTRYYDDFTMPAGRYDALRLYIGEGEGGNWWCVLYPALCVGSACGDIPEDSFSDGEYRVVTSDRTEFRFWIVEWFEGLLDLFR